jgi:hypothetical protein
VKNQKLKGNNHVFYKVINNIFYTKMTTWYERWFLKTTYYVFYAWSQFNQIVPIRKYWHFGSEYISRIWSKKSAQHNEMGNIHLEKMFFRPTSRLRPEVDLHTSIEIPLWVGKEAVARPIPSELGKFIEHILDDQMEGPLKGDTLEIHYVVPHETDTNITYQRYKVAYILGESVQFPKNILFPPYSSKKITEFRNQDGYQQSIVYACSGKEDLTAECEQWAGPLNNFYEGIDGVEINRDLIIPPSLTSLIITDSDGHDHEFKPGERITWKKRKDSESMVVHLDIEHEEPEILDEYIGAPGIPEEDEIDLDPGAESEKLSSSLECSYNLDQRLDTPPVQSSELDYNSSTESCPFECIDRNQDVSQSEHPQVYNDDSQN